MEDLLETTTGVVGEVVGDAVETIADIADDAAIAAGETLVKGAVLAVTTSRWRSRTMIVLAVIVAGLVAGLLIRRSRDSRPSKDEATGRRSNDEKVAARHG